MTPAEVLSLLGITAPYTIRSHALRDDQTDDEFVKPRELSKKFGPFRWTYLLHEHSRLGIPTPAPASEELQAIYNAYLSRAPSEAAWRRMIP
jgi:hypothetical protein